MTNYKTIKIKRLWKNRFASVKDYQLKDIIDSGQGLILECGNDKMTISPEEVKKKSIIINPKIFRSKINKNQTYKLLDFIWESDGQEEYREKWKPDNKEDQRRFNKIFGKEERETCEKCGGETTKELLGDEFYNICVDCGWDNTNTKIGQEEKESLQEEAERKQMEAHNEEIEGQGFRWGEPPTENQVREQEI